MKVTNWDGKLPIGRVGQQPMNRCTQNILTTATYQDSPDTTNSCNEIKFTASKKIK